MGFDQGHIRNQRALHHIGLAVKLAQLLAVRDDGADPGLGEKGWNARAPGPQLLRQRTLRREFQGQFTGEVLAFELFVLAHVTGNHFLDLTCLQQLAQAEVVNPSVIGNSRQVLYSAVAQRVNQGLGDAAQTEAADRNELSVMDDAVKRSGGAGIYLVHAGVLRFCKVAVHK